MNNSKDTTSDAEFPTQSGEVDLAGDEGETEGLALKITRFLRLCWHKRTTVFTIMAIGISISLALALLERNVYTSTTTFLPPDGSSSSSDLMGMMSSSNSAASLGSRMLGLETPGELYVSILESRNVLYSLVTRFDLMRYYKARLLEDASKSLSHSTDITLDRKSGIVSVSFTATTPELAAKVTEGYVAELNRVLIEDSTSSARRERIFLEGRLKEVKQQLDDTSKTLSQFATKSGTIDLPTQEKSMVDEGLKLQTELISDRSQLAGLKQTYGDDNPRVRGVEARIAELQRQMNSMGGINQPPGSKYGSKNGSYPSASELPTLGLTYFDLERKVQVQQALWETLTKQYETAKVEEAEQIQGARVLDVANLPERKSGPSRRNAVLIGALVSLVFALIAVVTQSVWESTDPQEEPKKLVLDATTAVMDHRRWYWSLPGMRMLHQRLSR